jgi:hypothetical protein
MAKPELKKKAAPKAAKHTSARSTLPTGGGGYTYEDAVGAWFLAALVREEAAVGSEGHIVRMAVQQHSRGEPMDDLIIDSVQESENHRLSFQIKSSLVVSSNDDDFKDIIAQSLAARATPQFVPGRHRYASSPGRSETIVSSRLGAIFNVLDPARPPRQTPPSSTKSVES